MASVFDKLGRSVLPTVFSKLAGVGLTDLMTVQGETTSVGTGGGRIKNATTVVYDNIPVVFEPSNVGSKFIEGDQTQSRQMYRLKFPSHAANGTRYNIDPRAHRLVVKARTGSGDEPQKVFRVIAMRDLQGNLFEAECVREN